MDNEVIGKKFDKITTGMVEKFKQNKKCLAAILVGSANHDVVWKWSDLQIVVIFEDSYKGPLHYQLLEDDVCVCINIMISSKFKSYLGNIDVSDFFICALSKGKMLFCKDRALEEDFKDLFYYGDRDREIEMLLGFSVAVYYLNKCEKNLYYKNNINNAVYFLPMLNEGLAWIEVAKRRVFPEREIIAQASAFNPELFKATYFALFEQTITHEVIDQILKSCMNYLKENTREVYKPIINYLEKNGTLRDFNLKTRPHGFGINYEWLVREGIVEHYPEPVKIDNQKDVFFELGYRLK